LQQKNWDFFRRRSTRWKVLPLFSLLAVSITIQSCQIFLDRMYQNRGKYTNMPLKKSLEIYQMAVICIFQMAIKCTNMYFPFHGPPKFTQIGIFVLKMYHLATLFRFRDSLFLLGFVSAKRFVWFNGHPNCARSSPSDM
jgi:hypothetical protein